ncbi:hypothetical protein P4S95_17455 [Aneurinibacillus aneurinilyticus]|uniref:hypothetical protein n=1 Tax=Aneurinibacillus aneurinilyticus TaxID=1391 RepID=UPI002E1F9AB9|nr:hypothetical protein [Aneurinibacillus aneurinilyticus]
MLVSGLPGYYLIYFLLTLLFYIVLRKKIQAIKSIFIFFVGSIVVGSIAPLAFLLFGNGIGFSFIAGSTIALCVGFFAYKQKKNVLLHEQEESAEDEGEIGQEEIAKPSLVTVDAKRHSEQANVLSPAASHTEEPDTQAEVDRLLAELLHHDTASLEQEKPIEGSKVSQENKQDSLAAENEPLKLNDIFKEEPSYESIDSPTKIDPQMQDGEKTLPSPKAEMEKIPTDENLYLPLSKENEELKSGEEELPQYIFEEKTEQESNIPDMRDEHIYTPKMEENLYYTDLEAVLAEEEGHKDYTIPASNTLEEGEENEVKDTMMKEETSSGTSKANSIPEWSFAGMEENFSEFVNSTEKEFSDTGDQTNKQTEEQAALEWNLLDEDEEPQHVSEEAQTGLNKEVNFIPEDIAIVQEYFLKASSALEKSNYEEALINLQQALDYKVPFEARAMLVEDYLFLLKEMGLYKRGISELEKLRSYIVEIMPEGERRAKAIEDVSKQICYIQIVTEMLEQEGKPNLPWSLIPHFIIEQAEKSMVE